MFEPSAYCGVIDPVANKDNKQRALFFSSSKWRNNPNNKITIRLSGPEIEEMRAKRQAGSSLLGNRSSLFVPSMNLLYIDPPFTPFNIDGIEFSDFLRDETVLRNGCSVGATSVNMCQDMNKYTPGYTILHEFGHAIGLLHEHQNDTGKSNPIVFKESFINSNLKLSDRVGSSEQGAVCYRRRSGETQCYKANSSSAEFIINVLHRYGDTSDFEGTPYDPNSIMLYAISKDFLESGTMEANYTFSELDKEAIAKMYPPGEIINIKVEFLDSDNQELWKKFFIKKTVKDNIESISGLRFHFTNIGQGVNEHMPTSSSVTSHNTVQEEEGGGEGEENSETAEKIIRPVVDAKEDKKLTGSEIALYSIIGILGAIFIGFLAYGLWKLIDSYLWPEKYDTYS
jgi:hypothetical protein